MYPVPTYHLFSAAPSSPEPTECPPGPEALCALGRRLSPQRQAVSQRRKEVEGSYHKDRQRPREGRQWKHNRTAVPLPAALSPHRSNTFRTFHLRLWPMALVHHEWPQPPRIHPVAAAGADDLVPIIVFCLAQAGAAVQLTRTPSRQFKNVLRFLKPPRDCYFADTPSPSLLKSLLNGEGGAAE